MPCCLKMGLQKPIPPQSKPKMIKTMPIANCFVFSRCTKNPMKKTAR